MKIKKYIALVIALIMFSSSVSAYAADSVVKNLSDMDMEDLNTYLDTANPKALPPISEEEEAFLGIKSSKVDICQ